MYDAGLWVWETALSFSAYGTKGIGGYHLIGIVSEASIAMDLLICIAMMNGALSQ